MAAAIDERAALKAAAFCKCKEAMDALVRVSDAKCGVLPVPDAVARVTSGLPTVVQAKPQDKGTTGSQANLTPPPPTEPHPANLLPRESAKKNGTRPPNLKFPPPPPLPEAKPSSAVRPNVSSPGNMPNVSPKSTVSSNSESPFWNGPVAEETLGTPAEANYMGRIEKPANYKYGEASSRRLFQSPTQPRRNPKSRKVAQNAANTLQKGGNRRKTQKRR